MSKESLNNWTAQTFINVQPFRSFERYNSMPKARSHDLKMHFCLFVSNCLGFLLGDLDSYFMQEMMSIQFVIGGQKCFQEQVKLVWLQRETVKQP